MFSRFIPIRTSRLRHARAAAPAPRTHQFHVGDILADDTQAVEDAGGDDDRRAVLIVVEDGNIEQLFELVLDDEAVRRLDVLEIDAAERGDSR